MVTAQIVSLIRHNHYRSSDHRGALSIRLLFCCGLLKDFTHISNSLLESHPTDLHIDCPRMALGGGSSQQ